MKRLLCSRQVCVYWMKINYIFITIGGCDDINHVFVSASNVLAQKRAWLENSD